MAHWLKGLVTGAISAVNLDAEEILGGGYEVRCEKCQELVAIVRSRRALFLRHDLYQKHQCPDVQKQANNADLPSK